MFLLLENTPTRRHSMAIIPSTTNASIKKHTRFINGPRVKTQRTIALLLIPIPAAFAKSKNPSSVLNMLKTKMKQKLKKSLNKHSRGSFWRKEKATAAVILMVDFEAHIPPEGTPFGIHFPNYISAKIRVYSTFPHFWSHITDTLLTIRRSLDRHNKF